MTAVRREGRFRVLRLWGVVRFCSLITGRRVLARAWSPLQREVLQPPTFPEHLSTLNPPKYFTAFLLTLWGELRESIKGVKLLGVRLQFFDL